MPATHFLVRLELRDRLPAAEADQRVLDAAMTAEGFACWMTGSSGSAYLLPAGEYHIAGDYTRQDVLEKARRAAAATGRKCAAFVTEGIGFLWFGLDPVPEGQTSE
jgi:hypothetical protein